MCRFSVFGFFADFRFFSAIREIGSQFFLSVFLEVSVFFSSFFSDFLRFFLRLFSDFFSQIFWPDFFEINKIEVQVLGIW